MALKNNYKIFTFWQNDSLCKTTSLTRHLRHDPPSKIYLRWRTESKICNCDICIANVLQRIASLWQTKDQEKQIKNEDYMDRINVTLTSLYSSNYIEYVGRNVTPISYKIDWKCFLRSLTPRNGVRRFLSLTFSKVRNVDENET